MTPLSQINRLRITGQPVLALKLLDETILDESTPDEQLQALQALRGVLVLEAKESAPDAFFAWLGKLFSRKAKEIKE